MPTNSQLILTQASAPSIGAESHIADAEAWDSLRYPLSAAELRRLSWLQDCLAAALWLHEHGVSDSIHDARRLAFARWLVRSHRLTED